MAFDQNHAQSDVDSSKLAQHHTIGLDANQVSPGNHNHDGVNSKVLPGDWIPFVPTWTSSAAVQPTLGDGVLNGRYCIVGKICYVEIYWQFGTTTTLGGAGIWMWALPFPVSTASIMAGGILPALLNQGTARWPCEGMIFTGSSKVDRIVPASASTAGQSGIGDTGYKAVWASGDYVKIFGAYPVD